MEGSMEGVALWRGVTMGGSLEGVALWRGVALWMVWLYGGA